MGHLSTRQINRQRRSALYDGFVAGLLCGLVLAAVAIGLVL